MPFPFMLTCYPSTVLQRAPVTILYNDYTTLTPALTGVAQFLGPSSHKVKGGFDPLVEACMRGN